MPFIRSTKPRHRLRCVRFVPVLCVMVMRPLFALDASKPVELFASFVDFNQQEHVGIYRGAVKLRQDPYFLYADRAKTRTDARMQIVEAIAYGTTQKQAHFLSRADVQKGMVHAYADMIRYIPARHTIELIGHARVIQNHNQFYAPQITYYMQTHHVISNASGRERVHIRFYQP